MTLNELAVKANLISAEANGFDRTSLTLAEKKFAELIITECAELSLDYKNTQHYTGWLDYRDEIRRHFGLST
jgi:hypothetical protein